MSTTITEVQLGAVSGAACAEEQQHYENAKQNAYDYQENPLLGRYARHVMRNRRDDLEICQAGARRG